MEVMLKALDEDMHMPMYDARKSLVQARLFFEKVSQMF